MIFAPVFLVWRMIVAGLILSAFCLLTIPGAAADSQFVIGEKDFLLNGKPFQIRGGEMHYARVPQEYWRHRMQMLRAAGFNTVSTYVFWNVHEPAPRKFDFKGNADIASYCRIAQEEGLKVIIRPGPYCCAEWDLGGLPWWLLKTRNITVRTRNSVFMEACRNYFAALGRELADLQITKDGPIIMVQIENEYGSYNRDGKYINELKTALETAGFNVPFYVCDTPFHEFKIDGIFTAINFGGDPQQAFSGRQNKEASGPLMCGEYYTGWFSSWGNGLGHDTKGNINTNALEWMLSHKASFILYMAHGGTSFGFNGGANGGPYSPNITSYDYGAPISEAGWESVAYEELREVMGRHLDSGEKISPTPPRMNVIEFGSIELNEVSPLFSNLPPARKVVRPVSMEFFDQQHGCILYRTTLPAGSGDWLSIDAANDYAMIFIGGTLTGILDRRLNMHQVRLPKRTNDACLDILVDSTGRIDYGPQMLDRKGITEKVALVKGGSASELRDWEVYCFPLDASQRQKLHYRPGKTDMPAFYRGHVNLDNSGDTFLDMRECGRGHVWVNGHDLGYFWNIGPQQTLYCPGPWIKKGLNEIEVFDLDGGIVKSIRGLKQPIMNEKVCKPSPFAHRQAKQIISLTDATVVYQGTMANNQDWQGCTFQAVKARFIALEALNSWSNDSYTSCAEVQLVDREGNILSCEDMKVVFADSEELFGEYGDADNVLDQQSSTFWHTRWKPVADPHPHILILDMGHNIPIAQIKLLPRQDSLNGRIKDIRIHMSERPFAGLEIQQADTINH